MKRCSRCKQTLGLDHFSRDRHSKDGLQNHCKACQKAENWTWAHERFQRYSNEELLCRPMEHRLEALTDCHYRNLRYQDVERISGIPSSVIGDVVAQPYKYCDNPDINIEVVDHYICRVLEGKDG
jgi:hypothetical protein